MGKFSAETPKPGQLALWAAQSIAHGADTVVFSGGGHAHMELKNIGMAYYRIVEFRDTGIMNFKSLSRK